MCTVASLVRVVSGDATGVGLRVADRSLHRFSSRLVDHTIGRITITLGTAGRSGLLAHRRIGRVYNIYSAAL